MFSFLRGLIQAGRARSKCMTSAVGPFRPAAFIAVPCAAAPGSSRRTALLSANSHKEGQHEKNAYQRNSGRRVADSKATIKSAVSAASTLPGSVVKVFAGTYVENNPIKCGPQVSIVGDSLREVTVVPQNADEDLFHVAPGDLISDMSFTGTMNAGSAVVAFDPDVIRYSGQSHLRSLKECSTNIFDRGKREQKNRLFCC